MQRILNHMRIRILVIGLLWAISLQANVLPDSLWTFKHVNEHHNSSENEIWLSADRPGEGTGSEVLSKGLIQWETGFEVLHAFNAHFLTLPSTLFRFGLHKRVELRMEYTGSMFINDHPDSDPLSPDEHLYTPSPLLIGTKILICDHRGGKLDQPWIPRTALLCNIGLPISKLLAEMMPVSGSVDLLFENEITEWLSLGYDVGVQWNDWAPAPDIFASLGINFEPTDHLGLFVESFNLFDQMRIISAWTKNTPTTISTWILESRTPFIRACNWTRTQDSIFITPSRLFPSPRITLSSVWASLGSFATYNQCTSPSSIR